MLSTFSFLLKCSSHSFDRSWQVRISKDDFLCWSSSFFYQHCLLRISIFYSKERFIYWIFKIYSYPPTFTHNWAHSLSNYISFVDLLEILLQNKMKYIFVTNKKQLSIHEWEMISMQGLVDAKERLQAIIWRLSFFK